MRGSKQIGWLLTTAVIAGTVGAGLVAGHVLSRYDEEIGFEQEAQRIAELLKLKPGMNVGDIRAGSGRWTVAMAGRVAPTGVVYATAGPDPAHELMATIATSGVDNISVITRTPADTPRLPLNCCDAVLVRAVYHHFEDRRQLLSSLTRNVRPGGSLLIVDFDEGSPEHGAGHGISRTVVRQEAAEAGFDLVQDITDWNGNAYCLLFRRR